MGTIGTGALSIQIGVFAHKRQHPGMVFGPIAQWYRGPSGSSSSNNSVAASQWALIPRQAGSQFPDMSVLPRCEPRWGRPQNFMIGGPNQLGSGYLRGPLRGQLTREPLQDPWHDMQGAFVGPVVQHSSRLMAQSLGLPATKWGP